MEDLTKKSHSSGMEERTLIDDDTLDLIPDELETIEETN